MKPHQSWLGLLVVIACNAHAADTVADEKTWTETYPVSTPNPRLFISNIWGNVHVRAGSTGEIAVTVVERRSAPTQALLEQSREAVDLGIRADAAGVEMTVGAREAQERRFDLCRRCRVEYQFDVSVPPGAQIDVSTVNDGRIEVMGTGGLVSASNVNGPVTVSGIHECARVESINGAIEVSFGKAPSGDCDIETINGDIALAMPSSAGLDVALHLSRGSIVSEFDLEPVALPAKVERMQHDQRYTYRIEQAAGIRLGGGGPTFDIQSLNGDVRIRKNK
jgi:hypothetical protein